MGGVTGHAWTRINFKQPRFQCSIQKDIKTIEFEAVLIIDDDFLHSLERFDDYVLNFEE